MRLAAMFLVCLQLEAASRALPRPMSVLFQQRNVLFSQIAAPPPSEERTHPAESIPPPVPQQPSSDVSKTSSTPPVHKKRRRRKPKATPGKVVVRNGSTSDPSIQFSTAVSPEQASQERKNTARLLATANSNIQKLSGQSLNPGQQDLLTQIRSYMRQAKSAEDAGDLQSAHNLALKAQLLSTELVRK